MYLDITGHEPAMLLCYLLMTGILFFALCSVLSPDLIKSAFSLGGIWIFSGILFMLLGQEILGVFQIIVYAGAILPLLLFSVMLTPISEKIASRKSPFMLGFSFSVIAAFVSVFIQLCSKLSWPTHFPQPLYTIQDLGKALVQNYAFPFEWISIILVAVLIAALTLARKDSSHDSC